MSTIFKTKKPNHQFKEGQWVRIKCGHLRGDVAEVSQLHPERTFVVLKHKPGWWIAEELEPYRPEDGEFFCVDTSTDRYLGIAKTGPDITSRYIAYDLVNQRFWDIPGFACVEDKSILRIRPMYKVEIDYFLGKLADRGQMWNSLTKNLQPYFKPKETVTKWTDVNGMIVTSLIIKDNKIIIDLEKKNEENEEEVRILKPGRPHIFYNDNKEIAIIRIFKGVKGDWYLDSLGTSWKNCIPCETLEQYVEFMNSIKK